MTGKAEAREKKAPRMDRRANGHLWPRAVLIAVILVAAAALTSGGFAMTFSISSPDFEEGGTIPVVHTCEGEDLSPELSWREAPAGTASFVLIVDDPDAPSGTFTHWVVYDIPAGMPGLGRGMHGLDHSAVEAMGEGLTGFGRTGYGGPCPPKGHGPHRYRFTLMALDIPTIGLARGARRSSVEAATRGHVLAEARTTGIFERR